MPELPEVEVVARQLNSMLCGREIAFVDVYDARLGGEDLKESVGKKIICVERRAKHLLFHLDEGFLLGHLRMTGYFSVHEKKDELGKKPGVVFSLKDGSALCYASIRRFGSVRYMSKPQLEDYLTRLGPEPLALDAKTLAAHLQVTSKGPIKNKLLDQSFIAGIGNIYALEALYRANISPLRSSCTLSKEECLLLAQSLQHVLKRGIERNGVSVSNYRHLDGKGSFQDELCVYKRPDCPKGHKITTIKMAGRGTYYCSTCQQ